MDTLEETLEQCLRSYAGKGVNGYSYFLADEENQVMSVTASFKVRGKHYVDTSIFARMEDERIIIEVDKTNKPLYEMLLDKGVPRQQIVLAYAGESTDTTIDETA